MIFVTIGTQEPFDRLIKIVDDLALSFKEEKIVAQVVKTNLVVENLEVIGFVSPDEFERLMLEATVVISHAGMGSIITALTMGKPIIVMPRVASLGEHRNEHQLATVKKMVEIEGVYVVHDENELRTTIQEVLTLDSKGTGTTFSKVASGGLITSIRDYIESIK